MNLDDFDYHLPKSLIARYPPPRREDARLLHLPRTPGAARTPGTAKSDALGHYRITDLPRHLRRGDILVVNDTRVNPWRIRGRRESGGAVEVLLAKEISPAKFRAMLRANRPLPEGETLVFGGGRRAVVGPQGREREIEFSSPRGLRAWLETAGEMPIPPYLGRDAEEVDRERYQTVFARNPGAVAAPTAGLHLSEKILRGAKDAGVQIARLTLHVGAGTFRPVRAARVEDHEMDEETCILPEETAAAIRAAKDGGGRVLAVGTTVVRALESAHAGDCAQDFRLRTGEFDTRLFIRPGFRFQVVDMMMTNFHLPRSTLLMLVSAFAGRERILRAYAAAIEEDYRFYSYGDAMLIG